MSHLHRRQPKVAVTWLFLAIALALAAVACDPSSPSVAPATTPPVPSAVPTVSPALNASPTAAPTPVATPSAIACAVTPQTGRLPSDRFVDLKVSAGATADTLTFVFGPPSLNSPAGAPEGSLDVAQPPYTKAGSGAAIDVIGEHVVQVGFSGMSLQNDAGEEMYLGPVEIKPALPALRHAVLFDASEGVVGWYVGYDGPGCVTFGRSGNNVTVTIDHP